MLLLDERRGWRREGRRRREEEGGKEKRELPLLMVGSSRKEARPSFDSSLSFVASRSSSSTAALTALSRPVKDAYPPILLRFKTFPPRERGSADSRRTPTLPPRPRSSHPFAHSGTETYPLRWSCVQFPSRVEAEEKEQKREVSRTISQHRLHPPLLPSLSRPFLSQHGLTTRPALPGSSPVPLSPSLFPPTSSPARTPSPNGLPQAAPSPSHPRSNPREGPAW